MQPTAQAVGKSRNRSRPLRGRKICSHDGLSSRPELLIPKGWEAEWRDPPGAPGPGFETWVSPRGPAPSRKRTKDCRLQPQSGVRMQPTAQAVGKSRNRTSPCRGERFALTTDCHPDRSFSSPKGDGKRSGGTCRVPQVSWFPRPGLRHEVQIPPENEQKIAGFSRKTA